MKTVPLYGQLAAGRVALVDDADYDLVMQHRWNVHETSKGPGRCPTGPYAITGTYRNGRAGTMSMHALLTGYARTDHKNRNGLDNQRHNLRPATPSQNTANNPGKQGRRSRFKGVSWQASRQSPRKWRAQIKAGKFRHLGYFTDEAEAARAYDAAAREAFGEYAYLNFPDR